MSLSAANPQMSTAFDICWPNGVEAQPATPLVFASPHSGRLYPDDMNPALDPLLIRRSEDAWVDDLVAEGPIRGAPLIRALTARTYLDVNRDPTELDPRLFGETLPAQARTLSPRVAAGLGVVARVASGGAEIYDRRLSLAEGLSRIARVHAPYHDALSRLLSRARTAHGFAVLIDWHSMPATAAPGIDFVLGDRFGASCRPALTDAVETMLTDAGYRTARNFPFAGGYTTEHYGRPERRTHALQVEINRGLYLDESRLETTADFERLRRAPGGIIARLAAADWRSLLDA
ncbi:N-formylglutamate amidohydrolase [Phenylobacterium sp.]|uniref:N-formylglutamate amidohydrolase n=1 Tax=Phenylobacterium sp. TaxID=1871053 RepID=UPI0034592213|nr:N-formylglutamate amidohydrolase [Phenylobacterium sp.]